MFAVFLFDSLNRKAKDKLIFEFIRLTLKNQPNRLHDILKRKRL